MTPRFGRIMLSKPKEVTPMNLGEKIYKLRKEKGLSQEALAELVGTTDKQSASGRTIKGIQKQRSC